MKLPEEQIDLFVWISCRYYWLPYPQEYLRASDETISQAHGAYSMTILIASVELFDDIHCKYIPEELFIAQMWKLRSSVQLGFQISEGIIYFIVLFTIYST